MLLDMALFLSHVDYMIYMARWIHNIMIKTSYYWFLHALDCDKIMVKAEIQIWNVLLLY